jgi:hypothetical protein
MRPRRPSVDGPRDDPIDGPRGWPGKAGRLSAWNPAGRGPPPATFRAFFPSRKAPAWGPVRRYPDGVERDGFGVRFVGQTGKMDRKRSRAAETLQGRGNGPRGGPGYGPSAVRRRSRRQPWGRAVGPSMVQRDGPSDCSGGGPVDSPVDGPSTAFRRSVAAVRSQR